MNLLLFVFSSCSGTACSSVRKYFCNIFPVNIMIYPTSVPPLTRLFMAEVQLFDLNLMHRTRCFQIMDRRVFSLDFFSIQKQRSEGVKMSRARKMRSQSTEYIREVAIISFLDLLIRFLDNNYYKKRRIEYSNSTLISI